MRVLITRNGKTPLTLTRSGASRPIPSLLPEYRERETVHVRPRWAWPIESGVEMTIATTPDSAPRYYVFYDAQCRLCARSRRTLERLRPSADVVFVDVQDEAAMGSFPMVDRNAGLGQMFVLDPTGTLSGGYDGFVSLLPTLRLLRPLRPLLRLLPVRALGRRVYAWIARNRYRLGGRVDCASGACRVNQ